MSWQAYTDALMNMGNSKGCAIVGYPDGGLWASTGLALQGTEGATLCARFANPNTGEKLVAGGVKYMATNCTGEFLSGRQGSDGICVTKSAKACIISVYGSEHTAGVAMNNAEKMAEDLRSKQF